MEIAISICTYNNGAFDVMFEEKETGKQLRFSGEQRLDDEAFTLADRIAPACVWTTYKRVTQPD